jgi:3-hydroxybutyryl-CoA dehydrogenase
MQAEDIRHILVVGAGTMGQQIAFQCAMHGFDVALHDIDSAALGRALERVRGFADSLTRRGRLSPDEAAAAVARVRPAGDLAAAAGDADLVSESVPEDPALKGRVFAHLNTLCPPETIFTTNTSTLPPSLFAAAAGRPDRFCALHFHLPTWDANVADVMAHAGTSDETLETVAAFARRIGQIPIVLHQEHPGYIFNDMFNALNTAAINLAATGVVPIEDVDRAWMGIMKTPTGPGGWLDAIGLDTVWKITNYWAGLSADPRLRQNADFLKRYIDQGRLGIKTGRGFYGYPDPAYRQSGFLEGN